MQRFREVQAPQSDIYKYFGSSPVLLWEIDLHKQRIAAVFESGWSDYPFDLVELLKNPNRRKELLLPEDLPELNNAMHSLQLGQYANAVFRLPDRTGAMKWFKITGEIQNDEELKIFGHLTCVDDILGDANRKPLIAKLESAEVRKEQSSSRKTSALTRRLGKQTSVPAMLAIINESQTAPEFQAVMFSHVMAEKEQVAVYYAGSAFEERTQGEIFSFEGTIAEAMITFNMEYMIVEDTMESLKPIDWALFVPNRVRSYLALPIYDEGLITGVFIVCANDPNRFSEAQINHFQILAKPFSAALKKLD
ncbi:GAF domain-containing protein [Pseudovibrio sp. Tun.PSC04-5.I4]|uniref:GAF domain-containing protein n=1 Tax=Pseudovibrio sp. Tun.PSC04-5.I4 TaxID=1798213 RepID=UPI0008852F26|nr:GAF domain-containing protein [Pseudovibrio sp. Tun.PSC04-5.I4]SDR06224.1 hypothetical protein SAMN04515695_2556 [Pseudovibrio sp. Tun.PSC04-5.I4]